MLKKLLRLTSILSILVASPVWADFKDGNQLHSDCSRESFAEKGICLGYIMAIADVLGSDQLYGRSACLPPNVSGGQVYDLVKQYLLNNPQDRHYAAKSIVVLVLSEAFPCN